MKRPQPGKYGRGKLLSRRIPSPGRSRNEFPTRDAAGKLDRKIGKNRAKGVSYRDRRRNISGNRAHHMVF